MLSMTCLWTLTTAMVLTHALRPATTESPRPTPLRVEQVQQLAELVTTRVYVQQRQERTLKGHLGQLRVVLWVEGEVLLGPSLKSAKLADVNEQHRTATLVLARPRVLAATVDLIRTRFDVVSFSGLWWLLPDQDVRQQVESESLRSAQDLLRKHERDSWREISQRQTEQVIERFGASIGWTLRVQWSS